MKLKFVVVDIELVEVEIGTLLAILDFGRLLVNLVEPFKHTLVFG